MWFYTTKQPSLAGKHSQTPKTNPAALTESLRIAERNINTDWE
jgi:hypothetical protein